MGGVGSDMRLWARDSARASVRCYYEKGVPSSEYLVPRKRRRTPESRTGKKIRDPIKLENLQTPSRTDLLRYQVLGTDFNQSTAILSLA
jgi:hypothetical protein